MFKKIVSILLLCMTPYLAQAFGLTFRVMNGSSSMVKFNSTDWLDWGTRIYQGDTRENWYLFSPKNMYFTLYNRDGSPFSLVTSSSCDLLGLPAQRGEGMPRYQFNGHTIRFHSSKVDIVIAELPGSTHYHKRIGCSLVIQK